MVVVVGVAANIRPVGGEGFRFRGFRGGGCREVGKEEDGEDGEDGGGDRKVGTHRVSRCSGNRGWDCVRRTPSRF